MPGGDPGTERTSGQGRRYGFYIIYDLFEQMWGEGMASRQKRPEVHEERMMEA
jgi:hypothetical protein